MTRQITPLGSRNWFAVILIGLVGQIAWTIENMYLNIFIYNTITDDPRAIAATVSASAVVATITTLLMGGVSDHFGKRKAFIVAGYILWGFSTIGFGFIKVPAGAADIAAATHSAVLFVILLDCVMTFFGSTANDAAYNAWIVDITDKTNRGRVEGVVTALPLFAILLIFSVFDPLTQAGRWQLFFLIIGVIILCVGGIGILLIHESPQTPRTESLGKKIIYGFRPSTIRQLPRLYTTYSALLLISIANQIYMPYLIIYIQNYLQIKNYVPILAVVLLGSAVAVVIAGRLIDKFGKVPIAFGAFLLHGCGLLAMYFARNPLLTTISGLIMLSGFMALSAALMALTLDNIPAQMGGRFQGVRMIFVVMIPMIIGPFIGSSVIKNSDLRYTDLGVVKQVPTPAIFLTAALVSLLVLIPLYFLKKGTQNHA